MLGFSRRREGKLAPLRHLHRMNHRKLGEKNVPLVVDNPRFLILPMDR